MSDEERPGRPRGLSSVTGASGAGGSGEGSLAPVIPLFGGGRGRSATSPTGGDATLTPVEGEDESTSHGRFSARPSSPWGSPRSTARTATSEPAPIRGIDPAQVSGRDVALTAGHPAAGRRFGNRGTGGRGFGAGDRREVRDLAPGQAEDADARDDARERAEALLLRKLRSRSLSISEARSTLREVQGIDDVIITELIDRFVDVGYLDDAVFAEQLVLSAIERRGEGRRAVAQTLAKRGIPRDIADAAIAEMPDDDTERALEYARSKARSVGGKDDDAALRRLAGQLARRGYPSSIALSAARQALREVGGGPSRSPRPASGVRFTPDE